MKMTLAKLPEPENIDSRALFDLYSSGAVDVVVVLGPTASGKTKFAVKLANDFSSFGRQAEIISADSRQVYRGMDIGTGKNLAEYDDIPYHLIDIADAGSQYNVFQFQRDFSAAWVDIRGRNAIPILCGGTGLYINAVTSGYDFRETRPLSERRENSGCGAAPSAPLPSSPFIIGTLVSREVRNARIDARLDARLQEGMVDEVKGLLEQGVPESVLISYGLEYKFVTLFLRGEMDYEEMRVRLSTAIHQFAKRQMTWFRGMERSGAAIHWTEPQ